MKGFMKKSGKVFALLLAFAMCIGIISTVTRAGAPLSEATKVTDTPTVNGWQDIFVEDSTLYAGGVWTDKSVFENVESYVTETSETESYTPTMLDEENNFLISLSAMASSKSVTGYSTAPSDTVLLLDLSSSMEGSDYNSILPLANACNNAVKELLALNNNNRVAVVLYSGADENSDTLQTRILMPLDRYTTTDAEGDFIEFKWIGGEEGLGVVSGVRNSKNQTNFGLSNNQSRWSSGTFTQDGIYVATNILMDADQYIEEGNIQAGQERMPIMVLMSDGEPSLISTDYAEGVLDNDDRLYHLTSDFTRGTYHTGTDTEFMVQLSAAYAKYRIEQKYNEHDLLFYSLGLKGNDAFATTILDPASHTSTDTYWNRYLDDSRFRNWNITNTRTGNVYQITTSEDIRAELKAAVTSTAADDLRPSGLNKYRYYIDKYFEATSDAVLEGAFKEIVDEIVLQSRYYPTEVKDGETIHYGGYLTLVDTLGSHMEVKDIKNIQFGANRFPGRNAAIALAGITSADNLTGIPYDLFEAVKERLHIDNAKALEVITASQESGVLYYNNDNDFKNCIGWYGNYQEDISDPLYIAPWDGDLTSERPEDANCAVKSYYFYGGYQPDGSVQRAMDMRYIKVEVVNFFDTGQTKVRLRIPASLIPLVVYDVKLDGETIDSSITSLGMSSESAEAPIRLLYEVGLKDNINSLNAGALAADAYNETSKKYEFYTNKYDYADGDINIGVTPPRTVGNSYAYFEPSDENEYLYYQYDEEIYTKSGDSYVLYTGSAQPSEGTEFYAQRYIYTKPDAGRTADPTPIYYQINSSDLSKATVKTSGNQRMWIIPKGTPVLLDGSKQISYKDNKTADTADGGPTGTYKTSSTYYINYSNDGNTSSYDMEVALGNNGKLSFDALQGIRLQKIVPADSGITGDETYEFTITPAEGSGIRLSGTYDMYKANVIDDTEAGSEVQTASVSAQNNSLTVTLGANQTLYIAELPAGEYTVKETVSDSYKVSAINGTAASGNSTTVIVAENQFVTTAFTNVKRETGTLTIDKEVEHPFGADYTVPDDVNSFDIKVTLTLDGTPLANKEYEAKETQNNTVTKVTTDENGQFTITLSDADQIEIFGLPEGTIAAVVEDPIKPGFTAAYWENEKSGGDGIVTIEAGKLVSVDIVNTYVPDEVQSPIISLTVNKTLTGRSWDSEDEFAFQLQRRDGTAWTQIGETKKISGADESKTLDFTKEIQSETYTTTGRYYYRVVEMEPGILGVSSDKALHGFAVDVTDTDMDGALEVAAVERASTTLDTKVQVTGDSENGYHVNTDFVNTFAANGTEAAIEIVKKVQNPSGSSLATLNGFRFEVYEADAEGNIGARVSDQYQPEVTTTTGTTRVTRPFTSADLKEGTTATYYYAIKEVKGQKAGWTYSEETKYVTVVLSLEGTGTEAVLVATLYPGLGTTGAGSTTAQVAFTNTYQPAMASLEIDVTKTLIGRDMKADEFTFEITPHDAETSPILDENGEPVSEGKLTATNAAAANGEKADVAFPAMYFNKVGTYRYHINETSAGKNGVTTEQNEYHIEVNVRDDNGQLTAAYHLLNAQGTEIPFVNRYTPDSVKHAISGTKELTGRTLKDAEFTFVLTEAADAQGTAKADAVTYTAKNHVTAGSTNTGTFTFPEITYDKAGTYYYTVTEQKGAAGNGVTYSQETYIVTVSVTDDGNGSLSASSTAAKLGEGETASPVEMIFTNTYKAAGVTIDISGLKSLTGDRQLQANEFTFEIYAADENFAYSGDALQSVKNGANGRFVFEDISFTEAKTYYYMVKENSQPATLGVTYDDTLYHVAVVVRDNGNGGLVAENPVITRITADGEKNPANAIAFYNRYEVVPADWNPQALKSYQDNSGKNTTLAAGDFRFKITGIDAYKTEDEVGIQFPDELKFGNESTTFSNTKDGLVDFGTVQFKDVHIGNTYEYQITEVSESKAGMIYDDTVYVAKVQVKSAIENGVVKAVAEVVYYKVDKDTNTREALDANEYPSFKNTYDPADTSAELQVQKTLSGRDWAEGESYQFTITAAEGTPMPAETTITLGKPATGNVAVGAFGEITYTTVSPEAGYTYVITEVVPEDAAKAEGMIYDEHSVTVNVKVVDDGSGTLKTVVTSDGQTFEKAAFANYYYVPTKKIVDGNTDKDSITGQIGQLVTFKIYYKNPTGETVNIRIEDTLDDNLTFVSASDGGSHTDGTITWNFTNVVPSTEELFVTVTARINANALVDQTTNDATVVIGDHEAVTNIVTIPQIETKDLTISKTVVRADGNLTEANTTKAFTFKVTLKDANDQLLEGYQYQIDGGAAQALNFVNGEAVITLTHGQSAVIKGLPVGTAYTVVEEGAGNGYTCADPDKEGTISSTAANTAAFTNTYTVEGTDTVTFSGTKTLSGKALEDGVFTFELYEADSSYAVKGTAIESVTNTDGKFAFTVLSYDAEDVGTTFYYVVKEKNAGQSINGITYSGEKYEVTVTVTDNGTGGVKAEAVVNGGRVETDELNFTNTYKALPTTVILSGDKTLTGHTMEAGEFGFVLYNSDETWAEKGEAQTVVNAADGSFVFGGISLSAAKTYYYVVKEANAGQTINGIKHDDTVLRVQIDVTDDSLGQLHHTVTVYDQTGTVQPDGIQFTNEYKITDPTSVTLEGKKTLIGRSEALKAGEFTFELHETGSDFVIPANANVLTAANKADGSFEVEIPYGVDAAGKTFYYVLKEKNTGIEKITYSDAEYHVTVAVTDNGKGGITASEPVVTINGKEVTEINFTNFYFDKDEAKDVTGDDPEISIDGQMVAIGQKLTYEIEWLNMAVDADGNPKAATITITDTIPANTTYVEGSASEGAVPTVVDGKTTALTWTVTAEAAEMGTVGFSVTVDEPKAGRDADENAGIIDNKATIAGENGVVIETNETKNDIPVKSANNGEVTVTGAIKVGDEITYRIDYRNSEDKEATITITDKLVDELDYVAGSASNNGSWDADTRTLTWTLVVPKGSTGFVTFKAKVNELAMVQKATNQAEVQIGNNAVKTNVVEIPTGEPGTLIISKEVIAHAGDPADTEIFTFKLNLKAGGKDLTGNYGYTVISSEAAAAEETTITNNSELTLMAGQKAVISGLPLGTSYTISEINIPDNYVAVEEVISGTIAENSVAAFKNIYYSTEDIKDVKAKSEQGASIDEHLVSPGDILHYEIMWMNDEADENGNPVKADVRIVDTIPEYTTYVNGTAVAKLSDGTVIPVAASEEEIAENEMKAVITENGVDAETGRPLVTWTIKNVDPKVYGKVTFDVKVNDMPASLEEDGHIVNTAKIKVGNSPVIEYEPTNTTENFTPIKTVSYSEENTAKEPMLGEIVTFTISYKNITDVPVTIVITDELQETLTFVEADKGGTHADGVITWTLENVAPEEEGIVTFKAKLNEKATEQITENQGKLNIGGHEARTNIVKIPQIEKRDLTISKTVALKVADSTVIDTEKAFTFDVSLTYLDQTPVADKAFAYKLYNVTAVEGTEETTATVIEEGSKLFSEEGKAQVSLKHNQRIEILDLPAGIIYTVAETNVPTGYEAEAMQSGVITTSPESADFVNIYEVKPYTAAVLSAKKTLTGPLGTVLADDQFSFGVYTDEACETIPVATGKNDADGLVTFTEQTFDKAGTYTYYIKEVVNTAAEHLVYDETIYKATVTIVDDLAGSLQLASKDGVVYSRLDGTAVSEAPVFENEYKDGYNIGSFTVQAQKELTGRPTELKANEFSFGLFDKDGVMIASGSNDAEGKITFSNVVAAAAAIGEEDEAAEETTVTEEAAPAEETTVTEEAAPAEETTAAEEAVPAEDEAAEEAAPAEATGPIAMFRKWYRTAVSIITGDSSAAEQPKIEVPTEQADGEYWYTIRELIPETGKVPGVVYDEVQYKVKITVINDGDNLLVSEPVYYQADGVTEITAAEVKFQNVYEADPTDEVTLEGTKVLLGRPTPLKADEFTFTVTDEAGNVLETKNREEGEILFNLGTFDQVGTYQYTITETAGTESYITYSAESYQVTVEVTDDGNGKLKAAVSYNEAVMFINEYKAEETEDIIIEASKELKGRKLKDGEFTFTATDKDGNVFEAKNTKDGLVQFNIGSINEAGEYKFVIAEVKGKLPYVKYSTETYEVTVVVTDDGLGKLKAEVVYPVTGVVFHNQYSEPAVPVTPEAPATGDAHSVITMMLLCAVSLGGMTVVLQRKKYRR